MDHDLYVSDLKKKKRQNRKKTKRKKNKKKTKKNETKKKREKEKKRMQRYVCVSYLTSSIFVVVGFISGGLSEIFMRDELCESSLRSFVPWIMDDMYWI